MSIRETIQAKLEELDNIVVSTELPDEMLEENVVYFSYLLQENFVDSDFDNNYTYRISLTGYIKIKTSLEVDSLKLVDNARMQIERKLKDLNIKTSFNDVSIIDAIRKVQVSGYATYNEINNGLL
mgnify:CR=1 FL=1